MLGSGEGEFDRQETLPGRGLQRLHDVLVAGVVGRDQHEAGRCLQFLARAVDRQDAAVVGQRVQHHGHVLPGLDHLVQIADRALAHGPGQRAVDPDRLAALQQIAADQVGGRKVVVAGDRIERPAQPRRHMGDEAGLAAAGRALQQQGQVGGMGGGEDLALVALGQVEGGVRPRHVEGSVHRLTPLHVGSRGRVRSLRGAASAANRSACRPPARPPPRRPAASSRTARSGPARPCNIRP